MAKRVIRQFDVCRNPDPRSRQHIPYFLVLQSDLLSELRTVVVAPLTLELNSTSIPRLNPEIQVGDVRLRLSTSDLAVVLKSQLGDVVANVSPRRDKVIAAIDVLFTGV